MKSTKRGFSLVAVLALVACAIALQADASIVYYGIYEVTAKIRGDDYHPEMTQIDSKTPGNGSTSASAYVFDSYGPVSNSWSIGPLFANEAQVNIDMAYCTVPSDGQYRNSYADEKGEVRFYYHSDSSFTLNFYYDLSYDIDNPSQYMNLNFFSSYLRLWVYDWNGEGGRYITSVAPGSSPTYPRYGRYTGCVSSGDFCAGDWMFIVSTSGSKGRYGGEYESVTGYVYLDFDGGEVIPEPSAVMVLTTGFLSLLGISARLRKPAN